MLAKPLRRVYTPGMMGHMNTTQRITEAANSLGLTVTHNGSRLVADDATGWETMSATVVDGRFREGYVVDPRGFAVSHRRLSDLLQHAERICRQAVAR